MEATLASKIKKALNLDNWVNVITSIGVKGKDKRMSATIEWKRGNRDDFDHFYSADDIAGTIVDIVPEDALSKGYKLTGVEHEQQELVFKRLRELLFDERILESAKLARIHGGAGIVKVTEDAKMDLPMPSGKKLLALNVVDRWDLMIRSTDIDGEITSPTFKEPMFYHLQISEGSHSSFIDIHGSRVAKFDGAFIPRRIMKQNGYWGDSVLTKLENAIRNYQISHDAAALTIQDFDIPVLKLQNLAEMMASDGDEKVIKRLEMVNLSKSIAKMIVLDADKEDFEHKTRNVTGMKEVIDKIESRLVTASKMPRTRLFGESAGGMGSTGESQNSNWYDYIESYQANYLKPKMLDIIRHIIATEFPQIKASEVDIEFNPLWQMTEAEVATMRKVVADTDVAYINSGVVDPVEIANSRFGGEKYSIETEIDSSMRETTGALPPEEITEPTVPVPSKKKEQLDTEYPKIISKGNFTATVNSDEEYQEAQLEGWK